jgi:hypothetical protein
MRSNWLLFLILAPLFLHAGGWPKKKGEAYYKLAYSSINALHFFDKDGNKVKLNNDLGFYTWSFYGEYGVTDRLTLISYLPFATTARLHEQSNSPGGSLTTIGDTNFGFKYGLIMDKPNVLSASLTLGLPFGRTSDDTSGTVNSLQTGDGEFNQLLKLESGHSFSGGFYASSYAGINFRSKGFSEEIQLGGELGHVGEQFISIVKFQVVQSLQNGNNSAAANADFFNNNMEIVAISPEIAYKFSDKAGLSVNYQFLISGQKTLASPMTTIGVFMEL